MKYFFDTEFLEGTQNQYLFGIKTPIVSPPTIDLISIGIVAEDGREYYTISKDFNIKEAWNRFQYKERTNIERANNFDPQKEYWIRDNVLKPIFIDLLIIDRPFFKILWGNKESYKEIVPLIDKDFTYKEFKKLINKYGKTNKRIAEEIKYFCGEDEFRVKSGRSKKSIENDNGVPFSIFPEFYAYYADYDWVVFCWLFGSMINLPKGFPMYCKDLKQILDNKVINTAMAITQESFEYQLKQFKNHPNYPKQTNEHNALADARWSKHLYNFLNNL